MEKNKNISVLEGEVFGLNQIVHLGIKAFKFKWYDMESKFFN